MKKTLSILLLIAILGLAAFLRLYRIGDYMTFLGDEGRDVMVAKSMLEGQFTLLGPRSSAGNFFMGPAYYYMITPFLWLFRLDPVGPAVMVALFSIATTWLVYSIGAKFFGRKAGLFASALYAVSPLVITYSHSSWNPDVLPFFSLLFLYTIYNAIAKTRPWKYFLFAGILLGISVQLHYLALLLGVIAVIYIFVAERMLHDRIFIWMTIRHYLLLFVGFLIGFSPFIIFEARHQFLNTRAILDFIFHGAEKAGYHGNTNYFFTISDSFFRIFARLLFDFPTGDHLKHIPLLTLQLWGVAAMIVAIAAIVMLWFWRNKFVVLLLYLWLFVSVLLIGFYKGPIYDYLFTMLFPLPFLIIGNMLARIYDKQEGRKQHWVTIAISLLLFGVIFAFNLYDMPFKYEPNRQKKQTEDIARFVAAQTSNQPFNFALLSSGNSDYAYRYYLELSGHPPVTIQNAVVDPQRKTVTQQLLIVCEDISCKPLGNSLWEVAGFGRAAIVGEWNVSVVKVYKLVHYTTNVP
jgi:4-amino-4-deoxy-L-arabinose transferase-like glycosyltransferase